MTHNVIDISPGRIGEAKQMAIMSRDLVEAGLGWSWQRQRIVGMMLHPDCVVLAARQDSVLAGFAVMEFHRMHAHLNLLAVEPSHRRLGVADQLLVWLTESARVAGLAHIVLEVRENNEGAMMFYRQAGYVIDGTIRGYYQGRENAIRMVHELIPAKLLADMP